MAKSETKLKKSENRRTLLTFFGIQTEKDFVMNQRPTVSACLLFVFILAAGASATVQPADSFQTFWEQFKSAVIKGDKGAVAALSRFPISMSFGVSSIRNKAQLLRRYREVFNDQTNAAKCFQKNSPKKDGSAYSIA